MSCSFSLSVYIFTLKFRHFEPFFELWNFLSTLPLVIGFDKNEYEISCKMNHNHFGKTKISKHNSIIKIYILVSPLTEKIFLHNIILNWDIQSNFLIIWLANKSPLFHMMTSQIMTIHWNPSWCKPIIRKLISSLFGGMNQRSKQHHTNPQSDANQSQLLTGLVPNGTN